MRHDIAAGAAGWVNTVMGRFLSRISGRASGARASCVLPGFVDDARCLALRRRAMELAEALAPRDGKATVFTADGTSRHAEDGYFLTSGEAIRCFFEQDAFDADGRLRTSRRAVSTSSVMPCTTSTRCSTDSAARRRWQRWPTTSACRTRGCCSPCTSSSSHGSAARSPATPTTATCGPSRAAWSASGLRSTMRPRRTAACGPCRAGTASRSSAGRGWTRRARPR